MRDITLLDAIKNADEGRGILLIRKSICRGQKIIGYSDITYKSQAGREVLSRVRRSDTPRGL